MNENDKIAFQQTALSLLRQYGMDTIPAPADIGQLSLRMGIAVFNTPLDSGDVEYLDFSYAPEQLPEAYQKVAGKDIHKIIRVKNELTDSEKLILITSMLVLTQISLPQDPDEEEHRKKKLTRCARATLEDLQTKLMPHRMIALCLIMSPMSMAFYFNHRTKTTPEKIIHNIKELDRFCLAYRVRQQDAIDRLTLLEKPEDEE